MKTIKKFLKKTWDWTESKRHSENLFYKILAAVKDVLWRVCCFLMLSFFEIKRKLSKGKLPDFLIIGVAKCGTTYLWHILKQHPEVEMSPNFLRIVPRGNLIPWINNKEIDFFSDEKIFEKGLKWYESLFNNNNKKQGEATPHYSSAENFYHQKMREYLPDAKLIILLRNPADRAFSAFNHMVRNQFNMWGPGSGYDMNKNFSENIELDIKSKFQCGAVVSEGFYMKQIENLLKYYPRNQLLIIITEQMRENPEKNYIEICDFLGIKNIVLNFKKKAYVGKYIEKLDNQTAKKLYSLYEPFNKELYKFLGYEIKEWEDMKRGYLNTN